MATTPGIDLYRDNQFCIQVPFLHDCDGNHQQPAQAPSSFHQRRNRQLPDHHSEMKETEDLLASELSKLSVQERSKALDDVHCVGEELKETPEMIERSLREFDQLVQTTANQTYTIAVNQNRTYVEDPSFRLKFLRANMFNIRKSVVHMISFLRQKALYFGESKVTEDIVPEDLNREEIALMKTGFFQILKDRDQNGRAILYNSSFGRLPPGCKIETMARVLYHIIFNMLISIPSVQTKGAVMMYYDESKGEKNFELPGLTFRMKAHSFFDALPLRVSSLHVCVYCSPGSLALHNKIVHFALQALSERALTRTRLHYGSDMERQYQLRSFGIPLKNFPVDGFGNIRFEIQKGWCNEYLKSRNSRVDPQASNENAVPQTVAHGILETDVLFGRGRSVHHAGNIRFRKFLDEHAAEYDRLPRHQRKRACIGYTQGLMSSGTRFLRQNKTEGWVVCELDQVVDKVAQFFRTRRRDKGKLGFDT